MSKIKESGKRYRGIYLAAHTARYPEFDIDYNDIDEFVNPTILGDMLNVDLTPYDYVIATPPCNYYSRGNYRRETSSYSQATKHLLPEILNKLCALDKPFIVENVRNMSLFIKAGLINSKCYIYFIGRHTYWSNIKLDTHEVEYLKSIQVIEHIQNLRAKSSEREGNKNVKEVIKFFIYKTIYKSI